MQQGQRSADRELLANGGQQLGDHAIEPDLGLYFGFLGVDDGDDVTAAHGISWLDQPAQHGAVFHVRPH